MDADMMEQTVQHVHFLKEKYVPWWCCEAKNPILCSSSSNLPTLCVSSRGSSREPYAGLSPSIPLSKSAMYPLPSFLPNPHYASLSPDTAAAAATIHPSWSRPCFNFLLVPPLPHLTFTWPFKNGEKEPSCSGYKTAAAALRL